MIDIIAASSTTLKLHISFRWTVNLVSLSLLSCLDFELPNHCMFQMFHPLTLSFSKCGMSLVSRHTKCRRMTIVLLKYPLSPPRSSPAASAPCPARTSFTARLKTVIISLKFTGGGELLELSLTDLSKLSLSRFASWIWPRDRPGNHRILNCVKINSIMSPLYLHLTS